MLVTGLPSIMAGIISSSDAFLSQSVIVTVSPLISYFKLGLTDTASGGLASEEATSRERLDGASEAVSSGERSEGASVAASSGESFEGATLLFSPSHPMRKLKAKSKIKYFIFVCDDAEVNCCEILQSE